MAYSATNPPQMIGSRVGGGLALWLYAHTDIHTDVDGTDYFTNGSALGMKVNDVLISVKTTATIGATVHSVTTVTAGGAATCAPAILA